MKLPLKVSVVISSHNPREDYLLRTLDALKHQTLARDQWELLLVDNASTKPVSDRYDVSWHSFGRHVWEGTIGLTHARIRGIRDSSGPLLVFVDDDNILDPKYLETAVDIADEWFCLGVWGGNIDGEFEVPPVADIVPYLGWLAIIPVKRTHFISEHEGPCPRPVGAGMCIRRTVANCWAEQTSNSAIRSSLGRTGTSLAGSEDHDLRSTAITMGLGWGMFPQLTLTHLIPERRLTRDYLVRLYEEGTLSYMILAHTQGRDAGAEAPGLLSKIRYYLGRYRRSPFERRIRDAHRRASERYRRWVLEQNNPFK